MGLYGSERSTAAPNVFNMKCKKAAGTLKVFYRSSMGFIWSLGFWRRWRGGTKKVFQIMALRLVCLLDLTCRLGRAQEKDERSMSGGTRESHTVAVVPWIF